MRLVLVSTFLLLPGQGMPSVDQVPAWSSVVIQGGAFALVTYIVAVLYPRATREARDEREMRDKRFVDLMGLLQEKFEARNAQIVASIEKQTSMISASLENSLERLAASMSSTHRAK